MFKLKNRKVKFAAGLAAASLSFGLGVAVAPQANAAVFNCYLGYGTSYTAATSTNSSLHACGLAMKKMPGEAGAGIAYYHACYDIGSSKTGRQYAINGATGC